MPKPFSQLRSSCNLGIRKLEVSKRGSRELGLAWAGTQVAQKVFPEKVSPPDETRWRGWWQAYQEGIQLVPFFKNPFNLSLFEPKWFSLKRFLCSSETRWRGWQEMTFNWSLFLRTHSTCPCMSPEVFPEHVWWQDDNFVWMLLKHNGQIGLWVSEVKHVCKTIEETKISADKHWFNVFDILVSAKCFWRRTSVSAQVVFARPYSHLFGRKITTSWTEESEWTTKGGFVHEWHQKLFLRSLNRYGLRSCCSLVAMSIHHLLAFYSR